MKFYNLAWASQLAQFERRPPSVCFLFFTN